MVCHIENEPPGTNFSENFGSPELIFQKIGQNIWTPYKKSWTPWNLFFKQQLKNLDPMELVLQKTVENYGPHGTYFSRQLKNPIAMEHILLQLKNMN